ncbi:MAG: hypothetical protein V4671_18715 [Armatimonadota bacterium]
MFQQAHDSPLWKDGEAFIARLPDAPRSLPVFGDPRRNPPTAKTTPSDADKKRAERMEEISKRLRIPQNPTLADMQRLMKSPEYREMMQISEEVQTTSEAKAEDAFADAKRRYDATTKSWLQKSGFAAVRAWRGQAIALMDSAGPQAVSVQFTTAKRFFDSHSGRLCWSGGCTLTAVKNGYPQRTSERKDPATLQFFIGQEGYFLKFAGAGIGENRDRLYQPFVTSNLFKLRRTADFPNLMKEPGDEGIFGFPFSGTGKVLRGKMRLTLEDNAVYSIGWEITPV